jgi:hypothetical protein
LPNSALYRRLFRVLLLTPLKALLVAASLRTMTALLSQIA